MTDTEIGDENQSVKIDMALLDLVRRVVVDFDANGNDRPTQKGLIESATLDWLALLDVHGDETLNRALEGAGYDDFEDFAEQFEDKRNTTTNPYGKRY